MTERRSVIKDQDGVRRTLVTDTLDPDRFHIYTEQVLDEIVAGIARDRETQQTGANRKLATLPQFVYDDLFARGIVQDDDAFKKWLNSSAAVPWRTWGGRV